MRPLLGFGFGALVGLIWFTGFRVVYRRVWGAGILCGLLKWGLEGFSKVYGVLVGLRAF